MAKEDAAVKYKYATELLAQLGISHRFWKMRDDTFVNSSTKRAKKSAAAALKEAGHGKTVVDTFQAVFKNRDPGQIMVAAAYVKKFGVPGHTPRGSFRMICDRVQDPEAAARAVLLGKRFGLTDNNLREFVFTTTNGFDLKELDELHRIAFRGAVVTSGGQQTTQYPIAMPPSADGLAKIADFVREESCANGSLSAIPVDKLQLLVAEHANIPAEHRWAALRAIKVLSVMPTPETFERMLDVFDESRRRTPGSPVFVISTTGAIRLVEAWNAFQVSTPEDVDHVARGVQALEEWDFGDFLGLDDSDTDDRLLALLQVARETNLPPSEFRDFVLESNSLSVGEILSTLDLGEPASRETIDGYWVGVKRALEARESEHDTGRP